MYFYDPTFYQGQADGFLVDFSIGFMKIAKIEEVKSQFGVYEVTFSPRWFQRMFKVNEKIRRYMDNGSRYTYGGGTVYITKEGDKLGNGDRIAEAIDKFRRRW